MQWRCGMADRSNIKPGERSSGGRADERPSRDRSAAERTPAETGKQAQPTGRVVHDERGNAVWDWVKQTSRICIESTSRLLRKLESPELKVEEEKDQELRLESDRDPGGGYDPYNQARSPPRGRKR